MRISAPGHFSSTTASLQHISLQSSSILGSIPAHNITSLGSAALHSISCHNSASFHRRSRHLASPGSTTILLNALRSSPRLQDTAAHFTSPPGTTRLRYRPTQNNAPHDSAPRRCIPPRISATHQHSRRHSRLQSMSCHIISRLQFTSRPYRSRLRFAPRPFISLLGCKRSYFPLMVNVYRPQPVERSWPIP